MAGPRGGRWKPILLAGLCALVVAGLGGTMTQLGPWYYGLQQPDWKPPDWAFGPAWTIVFGCAVLSAAEGWRAIPQRREREWMIGLFTINGVLNVAWSALFFTFQRPDWALLEVGLLWLSILLLMVLLWRFSRRASLFLLPYLLWVAFAAALNAEVVRLNPVG